jgi:hypothetical protein
MNGEARERNTSEIRKLISIRRHRLITAISLWLLSKIRIAQLSLESNPMSIKASFSIF